MRLHYFISAFVLIALACNIHCDDDDEQVEISTEPETPQYVRPEPNGQYHFVETFDAETPDASGWILSKATKDDVDEQIAKYDGKWSIEKSMDAVLEGDKGLVLTSKAKHSAIGKKLNKPYQFTNKKPLIIQYEVKFQNALECGGAYVKLIAEDKDFKLANLQDKTGFSVMFGPDKCGTENKYHFIVRYKNPVTGEVEEKHAKKSQLIDAFFTDGKTHLFTLVVRPDNTFQMMIDTTEVNSGSLLKDMTPSIVPDKEIVDLTDFKPESWDDREKIEDPDSSKPDDWDESEPKEIADSSATMPEGWLEEEADVIPDPSATKPDDWDDETDGEWEAPKIENSVCKDVPGCGPWSQPMIANPLYKGKWFAPMIDNINYQGQWEPRKIPNPAYFEEEDPFSKLITFDAVGLELWSMTDMIYFDNFIITDDEAVSNQFSLDSWAIKKDLESQKPSSSDSVVDALVKATKDKPWLWALYVLVVLVPVVLIFVFCCGKTDSKSSNAQAKKTDEVTADDAPVPEEEEAQAEEEEAQAEEEEAQAEEEEAQAEEEEAQAEEETQEEEVVEEDKPSKSDLEEEPVEEKPSPRKTTAKRRARKD